MEITTIDYVPEYEIEKVLGIVKGSTIRAKHMGKDIVAGLRHIIGGELKEYTEMIDEARDEAMSRMADDAKKLKADAIINVRLETAEVAKGAAEVLAYGTAVRLKR